jgi:hypothetical protein
MSKKVLRIDKNHIRNANRDHILINLTKNPWYSGWNFTPGKCEYSLYCYLSQQFNDTTILDIGTGGGGSAVAFSINENNKIISFDIQRRADFIEGRNIELRIGNFMEDKTINYENVSIIMIDVDPHDGLQEPPMFKFLEDNGWSGILLLDDIGPDWKEMNDMWNALPYEKYDVTDVGHWSGTGLINFGGKYDIELIGNNVSY